MTTPTTAELLKYADLQMAAEAFLVNDDGSLKGNLKSALIDGNGHNSKFTDPQADNFLTHWTVVDQIANTTTGFSGTLFRNRDTGELVMSMRSTEFVDDAARDNQATNAIEITNSRVPANGAVITLLEGQTEVRISLVETGALSANATANLSATYKSADPANTTTVVSNTWGINVQGSYMWAVGAGDEEEATPRMVAIQRVATCAINTGATGQFFSQNQTANQSRMKEAA